MKLPKMPVTLYCPQCDMVCYSKAGLVSHTNSKVCQRFRAKMTTEEIANLEFQKRLTKEIKK